MAVEFDIPYTPDMQDSGNRSTDFSQKVARLRDDIELQGHITTPWAVAQILSANPGVPPVPVRDIYLHMGWINQDQYDGIEPMNKKFQRRAANSLNTATTDLRKILKRYDLGAYSIHIKTAERILLPRLEPDTSYLIHSILEMTPPDQFLDGYNILNAVSHAAGHTLLVSPLFPGERCILNKLTHAHLTDATPEVTIEDLVIEFRKTLPKEKWLFNMDLEQLNVYISCLHYKAASTGVECKIQANRGRSRMLTTLRPYHLQNTPESF